MLAKRVEKIKPSPTLALAAKAKELKAQGQDVISLSVGEPDWDTLPSIKKAGIRAIEEGMTKYSPANGLPALREAIAQQTNEDLGANYSPDQVTVSAGGKFIIYSLLQSLVDTGDEVIIPAPYWVSYPTMVEMAEGRPVVVECGEEQNFKLSATALEEAISEKTKLLILNSPSNPTGYMYSQEELKGLGEVLKAHPQVWVMSDDIYNRLVFDAELAPHLLKEAPELASRTVVVNGASKTYSMTGWRVGWALGPKEVVQAMSKIQSQSVSCAATFSQWATVAAIKESQNEFKESLGVLKERRDFVFDLLSQVDGLKVSPPDGAFYLWPNISTFLGRTWKGAALESSRDFAQAFLDSQMVAVVPGVEFGLEGYLRLSYALSKEKMQEAVDRLKAFLSELK